MKIAKYRKEEYPGEWFLTDFTMQQVEERMKYLANENKKLREYVKQDGENIVTKEELEEIKTAEDHVHFCRNINSSAYNNILINNLIKIIKKYCQGII